MGATEKQYQSYKKRSRSSSQVIKDSKWRYRVAIQRYRSYRGAIEELYKNHRGAVCKLYKVIEELQMRYKRTI